jgi:hypothetical protein
MVDEITNFWKVYKRTFKKEDKKKLILNVY